MIQSLDLISGSILAGFVLVGAVRGLLLTVLWLLGLALAYVAAVAAPILFATQVAERFNLSRLVACFLLSLVAMFTVSFIFAQIRKLILRRRHPKRVEGKPAPAGATLSTPSRFLGGILGGLCGIVVTAVVGWCYDLACAAPMGVKLPDASSSMTARVSQNVMYGALYTGIRKGTDNPGVARFVAALLSRPTRTFAGVNLLLASPAIRGLEKDPTFLGAFFAGDANALEQHAGLKDALSDETVVQTFQAMGIMPEGGVSIIPERLAEAGAKLGAIVNDPATQADLQSLQADGLLEEGRAAQMMMDKRFLAVLDRIVGGSAAEVTEPSEASESPE